MNTGYILQHTSFDLSKSGGPQIHTLKIIEALEDLGHRIRLVRLTQGGIEYSDDRVHWPLVPYQSSWRPALRLLERPIRLAQTLLPWLPYCNLFDGLRFADAARIVLDNVDILYERYSFMGYGGVLLSQMLSIPLLLEVNGHPFDEAQAYGQRFSWQQRLVSTAITRRTLQRATMVLPSGYGWKQRLMKTNLLDHSRIKVIWPGIDPERFATSHDVDMLRSRWSLQGARVIAFTGSFDPWQGLGTLVRAFAQVIRDIPDVVLVLAGDGRLHDEVKHLAIDLECSSRMRFLGRVSQEEVAGLLATADIATVCIQDRAEFVPMKLFDYMASGVATVITAPQRRHDLILDNETGLVVEPGDVDGLAQALVKLLRDKELRQRLGKAACDLVNRSHTWKHRAREIEAVATRILSEE